jgi:GntR family transcriptional repressor for pyruvate dehydrogenase complex
MPRKFAYEPLDKIIDKSGEALYTQIVQRIRTWIMDGRLKEGDPIPSERELAQIFDVSRVPVREALKILDFMGAVEHVRGKGVYVKKIDMNHFINNIDFLVMDPMHTIIDLFEAREAIELQATKLAAQRRTAEDLAAMEDIVDATERNIAMGRDVYSLSMSFHTTVIAASHNSVLIKINDFLADLLQYSREQSLQNPHRHEASLDFHRRILAKIGEQDAEGAVAVMAEHLKNAKEVIVKILQTKQK